MNARIVSITLAAALVLGGCATASFSYGRDFNSANVGKIVKGKTTSADLQQLEGDPFTKTRVSDTEETWLYTYTVSESKAHNFIVVANVNTTTSQKTLNVVLDHGVVTNFTFTEGAGPAGNGTATVP